MSRSDEGRRMPDLEGADDDGDEDFELDQE